MYCLCTDSSYSTVHTILPTYLNILIPNQFDRGDPENEEEGGSVYEVRPDNSRSTNVPAKKTGQSAQNRKQSFSEQHGGVKQVATKDKKGVDGERESTQGEGAGDVAGDNPELSHGLVWLSFAR